MTSGEFLEACNNRRSLLIFTLGSPRPRAWQAPTPVLSLVRPPPAKVALNAISIY
ncbi:hypothetical protein J6590_010636, partial [Homalodisca vitripennis]